MIRRAVRTGTSRPAGLAALLAAVAAAWIAEAAIAHPTPAAVKYRWELVFTPGELRLYEDPIDRLTYWYFTYTVTNRTNRVQVWAPSLTLFTDGGEILPAGRDVPSRVTNDLLAMIGNPLLQDQNAIIGDILHGREHAKEGLVVWPARRLRVNRVTLFIAGISGETARVRNPINGDEVILRKTLERSYLIRGNARTRGSKPLELEAERWIMR